MNDTTPTAGLAIVTTWLEARTGKPRPQFSDYMALADRIDVVLAQARREGADAMREACDNACEAAKTASSGGIGYGWNRALDEVQEAIRALPLPGDAS